MIFCQVILYSVNIGQNYWKFRYLILNLMIRTLRKFLRFIGKHHSFIDALNFIVHVQIVNNMHQLWTG
jgi:hypothetical protein